MHVLQNNLYQELSFDSAVTLSRCLFEHGFFSGVPLCSGLGLCGGCRVIFHSGAPEPTDRDHEFFSPGELSRGHRLSCSHFPDADMVLEIPRRHKPEKFQWQSRDALLAAGVDLGTTSIKWGFAHDRGGPSTGSALNPQMGAGSEVMSRLAYALESPEHFRHLQDLLLQEVKRILEFSRESIPACITGNPAMVHLLLGLDISGLAGHPYRLGGPAGDFFTLPGIRQDVFIPPFISPFVGADISSGLTCLILQEKATFPFLFFDLGTNGELVLALGPDEYVCTSVALGPALEGVGLRFGSAFGEGVATGFDFTQQGIQPDISDWNGLVSGSGYLSLASLLLRLGCMNSHGGFKRPDTRLAEKVQIQDNRVVLGQSFFLGGRDVEEILKVKAAFTLGLDYLLKKTSMSMDQVPRIYLAGALGEHFRLQDLEDLGLLPRGAFNKCRVMGNTSLKGALMLAVDREARSWVQKLPQKMHNLPLAEDRDFFNAGFSRHMRFQFTPASDKD